MNAPISCTANAADRRLSALDAIRRAPAEAGRDGVGNAAEERRATKKFGVDLFGLKPLEHVEIPQNGQSFLWKNLAKTAADLEKLGENACGSAFIPPPPALPPQRLVDVPPQVLDVLDSGRHPQQIDRTGCISPFDRGAVFDQRLDAAE